MPPDSVMSFFNWNAILFCIGIYVLVLLVRRLAEGIFRKLPTIYLWHDVALPILPPLLGATVALLATMYPYPSGVSATSSRFVFGLVCGFLSASVYRVIWAFTKNWLVSKGVDVTGLSLRPSAGPPGTANNATTIPNLPAPPQIITVSPPPKPKP